MQPRRALHRQCIGVHHLYDIRSLVLPWWCSCIGTGHLLRGRVGGLKKGRGEGGGGYKTVGEGASEDILLQ